MKNINIWKPSKFIYKNEKLMASRDVKEVNIGSRLIVDIVAEKYDKNLKKHARGKLLDLGCGKVPLYHAYKSYINDNTCIDWENTLHSNPHLDLHCDLNNPLPLEDKKFDTVILSDVLEHISQPENLWHEIHRVLSVNGKVIINVPFYYCIHERPYDFYRYTEYALKRYIEDSGLELVDFQTLGGSPEVFGDLIAKHLQFIPYIGKSMSLITQYLIKIFIKTKTGKKISTDSSKAFPLGYFLIAKKSK